MASLDESADSSVQEPSSLTTEDPPIESSLDLSQDSSNAPLNVTADSQPSTVDDTTTDISTSQPESHVNEPPSQQVNDDVEDDDIEDDDELLALRIAALESIKIKRTNPPDSSDLSSPARKEDGESGSDSPNPRREEGRKDGNKDKPDFVIAKHRSHSNLVSIVTDEKVIEGVLNQPPQTHIPAAHNTSIPPPMVYNYPPPGVPVLVGGLPPTHIPPPIPLHHPPPHLPDFNRPPPSYRPRSRSRSPGLRRRRSLSPRYYSPPRHRYSSRSPPYRSPPPRRSPDRRITPTRRLTPTRQLSPTLASGGGRLSPIHAHGGRLSPRRSPPPPRYGSPGRRSPPGSRRSPYSYNKRQGGGRANTNRGYNQRREPLKPRSDNWQHRRSGPPSSTQSPSDSSADHLQSSADCKTDSPLADGRHQRPAASESEWETDTDPPTEDEEEEKKVDVSKDQQDTSASVGDKSQDSVKSEVKAEPENTEGDNSNTDQDKSAEDVKKESEEVSGEKNENESQKTPLQTEISHDDVLKLDASAEVDEFSKFLNDIQEEVLSEKEEEKPKPEPQKKPRIQTERKTVEGKKLRKKIKPKKERTPSFSDEESSGHNFSARIKRSSMSPTSGGDKRRYHDGTRGAERDRYHHDRYPGDPRDRDVRGSGGGRYDDLGRLREPAGAGGDNRGSRPRDAIGGEGNNNRGSRPRDGGDANNRGSRPRDGGGDDNNRGSRPRDNDAAVAAGKKRETSSERREREKAEYEAKLSKLSSPERERMEARRKKFEGKGEVELTKAKKISLKRGTCDTDEEEQDARRELNAKKRFQDDDRTDRRRRGARSESPPHDTTASNNRQNQIVTDLRVQLHKKKQARGGGDDQQPPQQHKQQQQTVHRKSLDTYSRKSSERKNVTVAVERNGRKTKVITNADVVLDEDELDDYVSDEEEGGGRVPPLANTHRVIMPPMFRREESGEPGDSGGSGAEDNEQFSDGGGGSSGQQSPDPSPVTKGGRRRVKVRSGEAMDLAKLGFTEEEVQREMKNLLNQKKRKKKGKKDKKEKKKLKKKKKSSKSKLDKVVGAGGDGPGMGATGVDRQPGMGATAVDRQDSFMDELDHFQKMLDEDDMSDGQGRSRTKSGSKSRHSSGASKSSSSRPSSSLSDELKMTIRAAGSEKWKGVGDSLGNRLKARLGQKVREEKVDTDLQPLVNNKGKLKRKSREMGQVEGEEESEDLVAKMAKKNKRRLERAKEIEMDRLMHS